MLEKTIIKEIEESKPAIIHIHIKKATKYYMNEGIRTCVTSTQVMNKATQEIDQNLL